MSAACNCVERLSEPLEHFSSSYFRYAGPRYTASVVCGAVVAQSRWPSVGVFGQSSSLKERLLQSEASREEQLCCS